MKKNWFLLFILFIIINFFVWTSVFNDSEKILKIIACDVGQGDAFLVTCGDSQILLDGGPNSKVLDCLSENIPFWDRTIEALVLSHPQKDHFTGLIDVFENYQVKYFFTTPLDSSSQEWGVLKDLVRGGNTEVINPVNGERYRLGLIYLDILYPLKESFLEESGYFEINKDTFGLGTFSSKKDPNSFSLVLVLSYGEFEALFTGDIDPKLSDFVSGEIIKRGFDDIEYIKVPHHGSKNGASDLLIRTLVPDIAVISVGENNSYGHPHEEIIDLFKKYEVEILRTDISGEITIKTDGKKFWISK